MVKRTITQTSRKTQYILLITNNSGVLTFLPCLVVLLHCVSAETRKPLVFIDFGDNNIYVYILMSKSSDTKVTD